MVLSPIFLTFLICHQIRLQHVLPSDLGYVIPQINNTLIMGENTIEVSHFCPKMAMYIDIIHHKNNSTTNPSFEI